MKLTASTIKTIISEVFITFEKKFNIFEQVYDIDLIDVKLVDDYTFSLDVHIYCGKDAISMANSSLVNESLEAIYSTALL